MPKQYDTETRAKAVRLVQDHRGDYASEYEAIKTIAARLGMNSETLRKWLRQAEVDTGQAEGTTTAAARQIRELKRRNAELEQTVEILKAATSFNACGESIRDIVDLRVHRRASCSVRGRFDLPGAY
jgi:transposase